MLRWEFWEFWRVFDEGTDVRVFVGDDVTGVDTGFIIF